MQLSAEHQLGGNGTLTMESAHRWYKKIGDANYDIVSAQINQIADTLSELCRRTYGEGQSLLQLGDFFINTFQSHEYARGPVAPQIEQMKTWLEDNGNGDIAKLNCVPLSLVFMEFTQKFGYGLQIFGRSGDSHLLLAHRDEYPGSILTLEFAFPEDKKSRVSLPPLSLKVESVAGGLDREIVKGGGILSTVLHPMPRYSLVDIIRIYDNFLLIKDLFMSQFKPGIAQETRYGFNYLRIRTEVELVNWLIAQYGNESLAGSYWSRTMKELEDNSFIYRHLATLSL